MQAYNEEWMCGAWRSLLVYELQSHQKYHPRVHVEYTDATPVVTTGDDFAPFCCSKGPQDKLITDPEECIRVFGEPDSLRNK